MGPPCPFTYVYSSYALVCSCLSSLVLYLACVVIPSPLTHYHIIPPVTYCGQVGVPMLGMPGLTTDLGHVYSMCGLNVVCRTLYVVRDDLSCNHVLELLQIVVYVFSSTVPHEWLLQCSVIVAR